jgi:hypothetical protein
VDIVLIKKKKSSKKIVTRVPNASYTFSTGDNLLILGERRKVELLSKI